MTLRLVLSAAIAAWLLPASAYAQADPGPAAITAAEAHTVPLVIRTRHGSRRFSVEVARSEEKQALGLMYRHHMGARHGMIFPMSPPRMASFWMKNTLIPLDLVFIRPDGTISSIAADAPTQSLDHIDSTEPVAAVLELNAGAAARDGLRPGDRVRW